MSSSIKSRNSRRDNKFKKQKARRQSRASDQIRDLENLTIKTPDIHLKKRYAGLIRTISKKAQLPLSQTSKILFCRRCNEPLTNLNQSNFTIRIRNKTIIYNCKQCNYIRRKPVS